MFSIRVLHQIVTTIFPKCPALSMCCNAAGNSPNAKARSITGFSDAAAIARFMSSNMLREPTKMPRSRTLFISNGTGLTVPWPVSTPIRAMLPPMRTALMERSNVPAPPTSTM